MRRITNTSGTCWTERTPAARQQRGVGLIEVLQQLRIVASQVHRARHERAYAVQPSSPRSRLLRRP